MIETNSLNEQKIINSIQYPRYANLIDRWLSSKIQKPELDNKTLQIFMIPVY